MNKAITMARIKPSPDT